MAQNLRTGKASKGKDKEATSDPPKSISNFYSRLKKLFPSREQQKRFLNHSTITNTEMQTLFAMKHVIPVNWAYMIFEHMAIRDENSQELPYAFFITKILQHFKVNIVKEDPIPMEDWELTVHICNNKMKIVYNNKDKTIQYLDDEVENTLSVPQETEDMRHFMDYMAYRHYSLSTKINRLSIHTQASPVEIPAYHYPLCQPPNVPPQNFNQANPQDNFGQEYMNQDY
ncbi:hypothetical protein KIW84_065665 [Lathyrus oleraceus]|uniref:Uncharacterized protein n=1 Tax=Pisum sativum TaxID=3888 RepID=A0A9D4WG81_PEA|nr:hypothetical protein KIW84_065665 [Pisum sativum]